MGYGSSITVDEPFAAVVPWVRTAPAEEGFGVLTEIDVTATMKAKLDAEMEDYLILGACNPPLAHRALEVDRSIGLLLPCNVVVRALTDTTTLVEALDPMLMVDLSGRPALSEVADDAAGRLARALEALSTNESVKEPLQ